MKIIKISFIVFFLFTFFACNNQQSKSPGTNIPETRKTINNKSDNSNEEIIVKKLNNKEVEELVPREYLVTEMLITSPRYKQLTKGLDKAVIKNGGQTFGVTLEGSPNPIQDKANSYSITYDYTVYEIYSDRHLSTGRFSFNPNNKQLYEYDVVNDKFKPIDFDKKLLLKYEALNK